MDKRLIILLCILSNLLIGNGILYFGAPSGSVNYHLMAGMSIACIICYLSAFTYINFTNWNVFIVLIFSIILCILIILTGCILTSVTMQSYTIDSWHEIFLNLLVGIVLGILGNIRMFPISVLLGSLSLFWFLWYRKSEKNSHS